MHQLVMLNGAIWLLQLVISSSLIHALGDPSQSPPLGFEPGSPDWETDDLPTELYLPPILDLCLQMGLELMTLPLGVLDV